MESYFFDTYAFFEILKGNPNYKKYLQGVGIVTTRLNLMELYYGLLLKGNVDEAKQQYDLLVGYAEDVPDDIIKLATEFRFANKKKKLSYIDCIGYIISLTKSIKFLTGDRQFKDVPNVEFVK